MNKIHVYKTDVILTAGSFDFFGHNFYSASMVTSSDFGTDASPSFYNDRDIVSYADPSWLG